MKNYFKEIIKLDEGDMRFICFLNSSDKSEGYQINVHPHWHDMVEILFVEKGSALQHVNDRIFGIQAGDIVIIRSQDIHATYSKDRTDIRVYQIGSSFFNVNDSVLNNEQDLFDQDLDLAFPIDSSHPPGSDISRELDRMRDEYAQKENGWEFAIISAYSGIVSLCLRNYTASGYTHKNREEIKESLRKVFIYIEKNYAGKICLDEAVKMTNYSVPHFCRIFRQNIGMTFFDYLNRYRINISVKMLLSEYTITEIAFECGFASINSYIRTFRKYMGTSPGRYRRGQ